MTAAHKRLPFYYFMDKLAYTEDHVLVKKLYLSDVPRHMTQEMLTPYLEKFGKVLELKLFLIGKRINRRIQKMAALVLFDNPYSASKFLSLTFDFHATVSDSWNQPDAIIEFKSDQRAAIMKLNDDCLRIIIEMLSIKDRIRFARSCTRFRAVYELASPWLHASLSCETLDMMTLWDIRDFFVLSGHHVQQISGTLKNNRKRAIKFLGRHCINLKSLDLTKTHLTFASIHNLLANLHNLESLRLDGCSLMNTHLKALKHLTQLKELDISHNFLADIGIDALPATIESLTLVSSCNFLGYSLPNICQTLVHLKKLDIRGIENMINTFHVLYTDVTCANLEELLFEDKKWFKEYEYVATLPALRRLTIEYNDGRSLNWSFLRQLVRHKSNQLEYLKVINSATIDVGILAQIGQLYALRSLHLINQSTIEDLGLAALYSLKQLEELNLSSCLHITNRGVLRLLLNFPKLQQVYLECCTQLTDELPLSFVADGDNQPLKPIRLHLYGCNITLISLLDDKVASKKFLDISMIPTIYSKPEPAAILFEQFDESI